MKFQGVVLAGLMSATATFAQGVPVETTQLGGSKISLYAYNFLTPEDLSTLRFVASNEQGLGLFIQNGARFAAIAVAPQEGFLRGGQPVASATAISHSPDLAAARKTAIEHCDKQRKTSAGCLVVLEVSPAK